jgi:glycosyltransferase involved in cell wall biosynthesis
VDLAVALHDRNIDVSVACSGAGVLAAELTRAGVTVRVLMDTVVKRRVSAEFARKLRKLIRSQHFDLVHAHIHASAAAVTLATIGLRIPLIFTVHSEEHWQGWRDRWVSGRVYRRADQLIAVSEGIRRKVIGVDGALDARVSVIQNAVLSAPEIAARRSAHSYSPIGTNDGRRQECSLDGRSSALVGVVARLQPEKGVHIFLDSIPGTLRRNPTTRFVIVGDGPSGELLLARARALGIEPYVRFTGQCFQPRAFLSSLDVLVVPSLTEGSSLVVLEAMAAGLPIVATRVGGIPYQIRHQREGLLVPPNDVGALTAAVLRLITDFPLAARLGEAALRRVREEFVHADMIKHVEARYRSALDRSAEPGPGDISVARIRAWGARSVSNWLRFAPDETRGTAVERASPRDARGPRRR